MKRHYFILAGVALAIAISGLVCLCLDHQTPKLAPVSSKAEETRLANMARQKKDGIIAPKLKSKDRTQEEQISTQNATPSRDTSLTLLDLTRPPTETELIKAGQLQEPSDPVMKTMQGKDNLLFGQAMDAWNRNLHDKALPLFFQHLKQFPHSPWAAESRLHIATSSLQQGTLLACNNLVELVLKDTVKGTAAYQKALLLKANALVQDHRSEEAAKIYREAMSSETDARRRTQASSLLLALSQSGKQ